MKKERRIIYYNDELGDEFSSAKITPIKINAKYRYLRDNVFEKALSFFFVSRNRDPAFAVVFENKIQA